MDKIEELNEIAQGIADVTLDLMVDSVDWQLEDFVQEGESYYAIHTYVMKKAIEYMQQFNKV